MFRATVSQAVEAPPPSLVRNGRIWPGFRCWRRGGMVARRMRRRRGGEEADRTSGKTCRLPGMSGACRWRGVGPPLTSRPVIRLYPVYEKDCRSLSR